jgi:hypothetical protein
MGGSSKMDRFDQLCTRMVHDVRTPLTILNMIYTILSEKYGKDGSIQEELKIMKEEIAKIDTIVSKYREELRTIIK